MRERISHFEFFVMLAVMRLGNAAYGVQVSEEMGRHLDGKKVSVASVYASLDRLESKAWVRRKLGDTTPVRGGRAKAYFSVTPKGVGQLRDARRALMSFWSGIEILG